MPQMETGVLTVDREVLEEDHLSYCWQDKGFKREPLPSSSASWNWSLCSVRTTVRLTCILFLFHIASFTY